MANVMSTREAEEQKAAQTATSAAATLAVTRIVVTPQASQSTVTVSTVTPGPSPTPTSALSAIRIGVANDGSAVDNVLQEMVSRLRKKYPGAEIVSFDGCDHRLITEAWTLIVMDRKMEHSLDGPACMEAIRLVHPETPFIGVALGGGLDALLDAGAIAICDTGDYDCLLKEVKKILEK
jgi:hypothetical protein